MCPSKRAITTATILRWSAYHCLRKGLRLFMTDTTLPCSQQHASPGKQQEGSLAPCSQQNRNAESKSASDQHASGKYFMLGPDGTNLTIPKELFVALSDFLKTRRCPGSITIEFRSGDILCVEAVAKKTFRNQ